MGDKLFLLVFSEQNKDETKIIKKILENISKN
jgi:hypothetical protein